MPAAHTHAAHGSMTQVPKHRGSDGKYEVICDGKSSKEIAVAMGVTVKTVETHRANVMRWALAENIIDRWTPIDALRGGA